MAVYRVNKNRGYTVMANYHLRDKTLSLKAVGLLSKMLSFNDGWQFSTKGLSAICKEGPDAVLAALRELEVHGYLIRHRQRDAKGRMSNTVFEIYEQPQPVSPHRDNPDVDNPDMDNPHMENPHGENPAQLNTNQVINNQRNNSLNKYQSINLDGMDRMDEREQYRELIRDNLEIDIRSQDRHYDLDRVNEIVEIMLDAICSTSPTIRINGEDMPQPVVKSRFLKLDSGHIDYVLQAMNDCPSDIRNIRAYVKEIPSSLESLQHEVGGDIEAVYPFEEPVAIVCNEEGKMNGLPLNRALRDDSGEIYDIVAGTFLVTGLTDDSFGSLSPDLLRQFMTEFKMPEQFAKIGDKIVAIPMISEEQQKQTVLEEKSSIVNENTFGMAVDGHIGTWHTIDHKEIDGHTFWLMEHDTFGDDASCIIVDEHGELVLSHIYDGFDETAVNLLRQEVMPVEKMPDDSISIEDMKQYGYKWGGMLPMRGDAAAEVMKSCQIYRLYGDDTEGLVLDANEIKEHAAKGGIFGVEKADWVAELEKQNPLKAAEMSLEDDYGMIDGIINNGPKEDKANEKASIMDRLKSAKTAQQTDKPSPHKEKKSERDL